MKDFCENQYCESPGAKTVPVSVDKAADQQRTLCVTCEEAYTWGVQHGTMVARGSPARPHLDRFLKEGGFVILVRNDSDPSSGGSFEAWAYRGPLDFAKAVPVVFGVGQGIPEALDALEVHVGTSQGAGRMPRREASADGRSPGKDSCIRIVALEVACMAEDAEDVKRSLFNPDSTQPSWYYDHGIALGPVQVSARRPTKPEDVRARQALDVEG